MWILLLQHYLSTICRFHTIFMSMEGLRFGWAIDLFGEDYNANYIIWWFICSVFHFQKTRRKTQNNSCKNVEQWRNSVISPLSCCEPLSCWWFQIGRAFNCPFMIVISWIFSFINSQKVSSRNTQDLYVKMTFNK